MNRNDVKWICIVGQGDYRGTGSRRMAVQAKLGHPAEDATLHFGLVSSILLNSSTHSSNALGSDGCGIAAPSNATDPLSIWWQQNTPQIELAIGHHAQCKARLQQEQLTATGSTARLAQERPSCQQADVDLKQHTRTASLHGMQAHRVPPASATRTAQAAGHVPTASGFQDAFIPVMTNHPFSAQEGQSAPPSPRAVQSAQLTAQLAVETAQVAINTAVLLQQRLCGTPPAPCAGANNFIDESVVLINNDRAFQLQQQQQAYAASSAQCRPRRNSCIAAFSNRGSPPAYQPQQPTSRLNSLGGISRLPNRRSSYSVSSMFEQQQFAQQVQHMQAAAVMSARKQSRRNSASSLPANEQDPWTLASQHQQLLSQQLPAQQLRQPVMYTRPRPRRSSYSISLHPTPEQQQQHWSMSHPRRNSWSSYAGTPAPHQLGSYDCCTVSDSLPGLRRHSLAVPCSTPLPPPSVWPGVRHANSSNSSCMAASAANQGEAAAAAGIPWLLPWADGRMLAPLPEEVADTPSAGLEEAMAAAAAAAATPALGLHGGTNLVYGSAVHSMDSMGSDHLMQRQELPAMLPADGTFAPDVHERLQQLGLLDEEGVASMLAANMYSDDYPTQQQQHASLDALRFMHQHQEQQPRRTNFWEHQPQVRPTADDFIRLTGGAGNMACSVQLPAVPDLGAVASASSSRSSISTPLPLQRAGLTVQQQQQGYPVHQRSYSVAQQQQSQPEALHCWRSSDSGAPLASSSSSSSTCDYTSKQAPASAAAAAAAAVAGIRLDSGAKAMRIIQQELEHLQQLRSQLAAAAAAAAGTPVAAACAAALHMHEGAMQQAVATKAALGAALDVPVDAAAGACMNSSKAAGGDVMQRQQPYQVGVTQPCDSAQFGMRGESPGTLDSQGCYCTVGSTV